MTRAVVALVAFLGGVGLSVAQAAPASAPDPGFGFGPSMVSFSEPGDVAITMDVVVPLASFVAVVARPMAYAGSVGQTDVSGGWEIGLEIFATPQLTAHWEIGTSGGGVVVGAGPSLSVGIRWYPWAVSR